MDQQDRRIYEIVEEVEKQQTQKESNLITLSCGVVLKTRPVPPMILSKIDKKYPEPPMPTVYDEDRGRDIPNPQDPNWLKAVDRNAEDKGTALIDVIAGLGTTVHFVPEGMYHAEQDEWAEQLEYYGLEIPEKGIGRYLSWLKFYVIASGEDLALIAKKAAKSLGVTEEEVATAINNFQSAEE